MHYQVKDLFQLQTELVEAKVDMATSKAIDRVLDRIDGLQKDMDLRFTSLEKDMVAVKTKLGMSDETKQLVRSKWIDYAFKTGWTFAATLIAWVIVFGGAYLHTLFKSLF